MDIERISDNLKIVLWGIGIIGKRLVSILPYGSIAAIIDSNCEHQGLYYEEIPVISFETYLQKFRSCPVYISPLKGEEIIVSLKTEGIENYWLSTDEPLDMYAKDRRTLSEIFDRVYSEIDNIAVIGGTLFSIHLYEYLRRKNRKVDYLLYKTEHSVSTYHTIENCIAVDEAEFSEYNSILICNREFIRENAPLCSDNRFVDATDSFLYSYSNEYPRLAQCKDIYRDKRCFIVANGPSLLTSDLELLHKNNEITFGVNRIFKTSDQVTWRPNVYVVSETNFADIERNVYLQYSTDYKFITDGAKLFWSDLHDENIYKYNCRPDYGGHGMHVSDDITRCVYVSMTVIHACLQFAMYMGCKEIYLIGADTTGYDKARKIYMKSHFSKNYDTEYTSKLPYVPFLDTDRIMKGYESIKKYAEKNGIKIYNATRGGALDVFKRVNLDEVLK